MKVKGGKYKLPVTVLKTKNGKPTVIEVEGHVYQLQNTFRNNGAYNRRN